MNDFVPDAAVTAARAVIEGSFNEYLHISDAVMRTALLAAMAHMGQAKKERPAATVMSDALINKAADAANEAASLSDEHCSTEMMRAAMAVAIPVLGEAYAQKMEANAAAAKDVMNRLGHFKVVEASILVFTLAAFDLRVMSGAVVAAEKTDG